MAETQWIEEGQIRREEGQKEEVQQVQEAWTYTEGLPKLTAGSPDRKSLIRSAKVVSKRFMTVKSAERDGFVFTKAARPCAAGTTSCILSVCRRNACVEEGGRG